MKNAIFKILVALLFVPMSNLLAQKKVHISDDVVKTAEQIDFDYKGQVKKALKRDTNAIVKMYEFSRIVDGKQSIEHAVTCLEIIPIATDSVVALATKDLNVKLKKVVLERLIQAQGKTKKEALKKPFQSWAPYTWEALNNRPVVFPSETRPGTMVKPQDMDAVQNPEQQTVQPSEFQTQDADQVRPTSTTAPQKQDSKRGDN